MIFPFYFLLQIHSNEILNLFKVVSKVGPKIKVAQKNVLYNFAKKSKAKIQLDFEGQAGFASWARSEAAAQLR